MLGGFAAAAIAVPMVGLVPPIDHHAGDGGRRRSPAAASGSGSPAILRYARGVNETISSLLLTYIGIAIMNFFVEGVMRDASNPNKPSTKPIGDAYMVGKIPGTDVHWGFAVGVLLCDRPLFPDDAHHLRLRGARHRRQFPRRAGAGAAGRQADRRLRDDRRRLRGAGRLLRGGGDPGPRQRLAGGRLRLHRHPRVVPGAPQSAGHRSGRDPVRRPRRRPAA